MKIFFYSFPLDWNRHIFIASVHFLGRASVRVMFLGCHLYSKFFGHNPVLIDQCAECEDAKFFKIEQFLPLPLSDFR